jgi:hypothetical protein
MARRRKRTVYRGGQRVDTQNYYPVPPGWGVPQKPAGRGLTPPLPGTPVRRA